MNFCESVCGLKLHLTVRLSVFFSVTQWQACNQHIPWYQSLAEAIGSGAGTFCSGAGDHSMQWGSCIVATPGSGRSLQGMATLMRVAGESWAGPAAAAATPRYKSLP